MLSTCITDFNMLWNFQHTFKHENLKHLQSNFYFYIVQIYVNQGSYKLSMTDHYGGQVNNWPHGHTPSWISM